MAETSPQTKRGPGLHAVQIAAAARRHMTPTERCASEKAPWELNDHEGGFVALVDESLYVYLSYTPRHSVRLFYYACFQNVEYRHIATQETLDALAPFKEVGPETRMSLRSAMLALYAPNPNL